MFAIAIAVFIGFVGGYILCAFFNANLKEDLLHAEADVLNLTSQLRSRVKAVENAASSGVSSASTPNSKA